MSSETASIEPERMATRPVATGVTWPMWVREHRVASAILAGFVATHVTSLVGYWLPSIGLPKLDWNTTNGAILVPEASAMTQFVVGGIYHTLTGIVFALLFAFVIHPLLPGANTLLNNLLKAVAFSTVLAFVSTLWMIPQIYFPDADAGFMSFNLGTDLVFAIFVWHWVYGLNLGTFYNPAPPDGD